MLKSLCLALLLAALPCFAGDATVYETLLTKRVDGELVIDTEGNVVSHAFKTDVEPDIRAMLDGAVATWKFHPYLVDGVPVRARSKMRVTIAARQDAGKYTVSIDNVNFNGDEKDAPSGAGEKGGKVQMRVTRRPQSVDYPQYAVNGMTVVAVRLGVDGKVEDAVATETTFFNATGNAGDFEQARRQMEQNAVRGIRRWKFEVSVSPGFQPRPEDLTGIITVNYVLAPGETQRVSGAPGKWRQETRAPNRGIPWISDQRLARSVRASGLDAQSAMMDFGSGFRLREGDAGAVL